MDVEVQSSDLFEVKILFGNLIGIQFLRAIDKIQNKNKNKLKTNNGKKSYHLTIMSKRTGWKSNHLLNMI